MDPPFLQFAWVTSTTGITDNDKRILFVVGCWLSTTGVSLLLNTLLAVVYFTGMFERYKIQHAKWPSAELVKKCLLKTILLDNIVIRVLLLWFLYPFLAQRLDAGVDVPTVATMAWQILASMLINNCFFYWAHRVLHHRRIYKYIHKQHHEFKATVGIAAEYAHPVESLLANAVPTMAGPLIFKMHWTTLWIWAALREWETVDAHCGYEFPWSPWSMIPFLQGGADRHDFHHSHWNNGNYGGAFFHFWDWACGTDQDYLKWKRAQRGEAKKAE